MPDGANSKMRRRYSIGEWYGQGLEVLSSRQRFEYARREIEVNALTGTPCPFQQNANCNKKGGVCSLRLYEQRAGGPVCGTGPIITTCPLRFLEDGVIFRWVGETVLETADPIVLSEIGFLDRLRPDAPEGDEESGDFIGRIDNVVVHPSGWCAAAFEKERYD